MRNGLEHPCYPQRLADTQADSFTAVMGWYQDETGQKQSETSPPFPSSTAGTPSPVPELVLHFCASMAASCGP